MKSQKLFKHKLFVGLVGSVLIIALFGCSLLYQINAADKLVKKAEADQKKASQTLEKAATFDSEIDSLKPTEDNASTIVSKTSGLKENVKNAKEDLANAKEKLAAAKKLRLPDWYKKKYIGKLEKVVEKKEEGLKEMEKMLAKTENYGKSIQDWYKGYHSYNQYKLSTASIAAAAEASDFKGAATEAEKARTNVKNAQTEFNNAASFVNIKMYSDARDASGIFAQEIDPLQQLLSLADQIVNNPTADLFAQFESLLAQMQQIEDKANSILPKDVPEDGSIPQAGQDQLSQWRKDNIKNFVAKTKDAIKEAEDLRDEAISIKAEEK